MRNRIFVQKKLAKASKVNASSSKILKANFSKTQAAGIQKVKLDTLTGVNLRPYYHKSNL